MPEPVEAALLAFVRTSLLKGRRVVLTAETPLFEDRLLNSINILGLIGYIERARGRRLDARDLVMDNFRDVGTIVRRFLS